MFFIINCYRNFKSAMRCQSRRFILGQCIADYIIYRRSNQQYFPPTITEEQMRERIFPKRPIFNLITFIVHVQIAVYFSSCPF